MKRSSLCRILLAAAALTAALALLECAALAPALLKRLPLLRAVSGSPVYHGALLSLVVLCFAAVLAHLIKSRRAPDALRPYLIMLLAVLAAECCLFNFRFFESMGFPASQPLAAAYGNGLRLEENGYALREDRSTYLVQSGEAENTATITLTGMDGKPMQLSSLYLGLSGADEPYATVQITCFDEGNALGTVYPAISIYESTARTQYLRLHPAGKVTKLVVAVSNVKFLWVTDFCANPRIPLRVSPLRIAVLFLVLLLLYAIRPGSPLYRHTLDLHAPWQRRLARLVCGCLVLLLILPMLFCHDPSVQDQEYQRLTESFFAGRLDFAEAPSPELLALENPYDLTQRIEQKERIGQEFYLWDHALYHGRYYMYFGVTPVLLYFLPFRALTGRALPTVAAVAVSTALFAFGMFALLHRLSRRFRAPSLLTYLILASSAVLSSGVLLAKMPTVYHVPVSMGLALAVWGLYLWDTAEISGERPSLWRLAAGSLCLALVFGCRPQIGLAFLLGIPMFLRPVLLTKRPFAERARYLAALTVPFLLVAAGLMWYNAARFGSVFDFGANYNLTSNDMRLRGWNLDRVGPGLFYMFFSLPSLSAAFPFLQPLAVQTAYQGVTVAEHFYGGVFAAAPVLLFVPFLFAYRKNLQEKRLWAAALLLLLLPPVILSLDAQMAGLLHRYRLDVLFLLFLLCAMACFSIEEAESGKLLRLFRWGLFLAAVLGGAYAFCYLFAAEPEGTIWRESFPSLVADLCTGWLR